MEMSQKIREGEREREGERNIVKWTEHSNKVYNFIKKKLITTTIFLSQILLFFNKAFLPLIPRSSSLTFSNTLNSYFAYFLSVYHSFIFVLLLSVYINCLHIPITSYQGHSSNFLAERGLFGTTAKAMKRCMRISIVARRAGWVWLDRARLHRSRAEHQQYSRTSALIISMDA